MLNQEELKRRLQVLSNPKILFGIGLFMVCSMKSVPPATGKHIDATNTFIKNEVVETFINDDSINVLKSSKEGASLEVYYTNDSISINAGKKKTFKIPYKSAVDKILPCVGLFIKKGDKEYLYADHYIFRDSILLLPVQEINNRINLVVINISSGSVIPAIKPRESDFLTTAYPWFGFDVSKGIIITTNSIPLQCKTGIHKYKLGTGLSYVGMLSENINSEAKSDEKELERIMTGLLK